MYSHLDFCAYVQISWCVAKVVSAAPSYMLATVTIATVVHVLKESKKELRLLSLPMFAIHILVIFVVA